ncbi:MAG: cobalamin biosynthesis protein [Acetobacter orientalis]|uniref:cobalamin biosynthesis protein n=1 Tax=Acetobacter orientalis TaxID=146474 RepID=UPI0039E87C9D
MSVIVGFGWRSGASSATALALLRTVMGHYAVQKLDMLALPDFKQHDRVAQELTLRCGIGVVWVTKQSMAVVQPLCLTYSASVAQKVGVASVAEACALVAAGAGGRLYGPRMVQGGVTCALAQGV